MAEDPKVSGHYRQLPREEPPRALDDAILAASRRAVEARPAPLVAPTGRRRWYFPVAAAAVIVLAVAVVAHIEREQPDSEILQPPMTILETPLPPPAPPAREARRAEAPRQAQKQASPGFAAEPPRAAAGAAAPVPAPAAEAEQRGDVGAASAGARVTRSESARAQTQMARASVEQSPELELERIARLRTAGRHEEADKALAEFRKRYPDYKISEAMLEKVEKR